MSDVTVPPTWEHLVSLVHYARDLGAPLPHAVARDIARHRASLPSAPVNVDRGNAHVLSAFLATGETDCYVHTILDALWSRSDVAQLSDRDGMTVRMFAAYLVDRKLNTVTGPPCPGPVENWDTLPLDS